MNNTIISERSTKPSVLKEFEPSKQPAPIIGRSEINNMTNSNSGWLASMSSMTKLLLLSLIASFAFGAYTFWNGNNAVSSAEKKADSSAITLASDSLNPTLNLDVNRLSQLGIESPGQITSIPIREIQVGMRVPAHNPEVSEQERSSWLNEIKPETWRKFTLDVEKQDGSGSVGVTLLRPSSWLVAESENTNLALLELAVENAAKEWDQTPTWAKTINECVYSVSVDALMDRLSVGVGWGQKSWQYASSGHLVVGVANLGLSELIAPLIEQAAYEIALDETTREIQSGGGIGTRILLNVPEKGAVGFATVVSNDSFGKSDVDRFLVKNGLKDEKVDPSTWKKITMLCPRADGSETDVTFLRSPNWIRESIRMASGHQIEEIGERLVGKPIEIVIPEIALSGMATVVSIENCPVIIDGPGEVVTGTFRTNRARIIDLSFTGLSDSIGVTPLHPIWSVTRREFVAAEELKINEKVLALNGQRTYLSRITLRVGSESVYNFEVANSHVYFVGRDGLLVHNADYLTEILQSGQTIVRDAAGRFANFSKNGITARTADRLRRVDPNAASKIRILANYANPSYLKNIKNSNGLRKGMQWGHKRGWENRRLLKAADQLGLSQKQLNKYVQANANKLFQIESKARNLSHLGEQPGNSIAHVLIDMRKFFGF